MTQAGFHRDLTQPGSWLSDDGIPVDLMVPDALSGTGGRRGARIPPHSSKAARRTPALKPQLSTTSRCRSTRTTRPTPAKPR